MSQTLPTGPAYRIETARLVIRCWKPRDAPFLNAALRASWEHLGPWMPWARSERPTVANTASLLRRWRGEFDLDQDYVYAIFNRDETLALGSSGLHTRSGPGTREMGYWIHADHINRGYATEVAEALTKVAFEIDAVRLVEIRCLTNNVRSAAVPRKLGYTHEATLTQRIPTGDESFGDTMIWTMHADAYPDSRAARIELCAFDAMGQKLL
jgi:RimJ/RimL family protein N-acetyltransferase